MRHWLLKGAGPISADRILGLSSHCVLKLDFRQILGIIAAVTTDFLTGSRNEALEDLMARLAVMAPRGVLRGESGMPTGTVKWFNSTKGYGFIAAG